MITLVTGATGFVGSNIVRSLALKGHEIVALDIAPPTELVKRYLGEWSHLITWVEGDITDVSKLNSILGPFRLTKIIHAAAMTPSLESMERDGSETMLNININGSFNLLGVAQQKRIEKFLYVSSGGVYAGNPPTQIMKEDIHLYPNSLYGIGKYACEMITTRYGQLHDFQTVSVRFASVYGPMERETGHRSVMSLVCRWTGQALRGEVIDRSQVSKDQDFVYGQDVGDAVTHILDSPYLSHQVYNIGSGVRVSNAQLEDAILKALPDTKFSGVAQDVNSPPQRGLMDIARLKESGYTPPSDIYSGIKKFIAWRKELSFLD